MLGQSARKGETNLISGVFQPAKVAVYPAAPNETGRVSRIRCFFKASCPSRDLQCGSFRYFAERGEAPKRYEKLARERDDRNSAMAAPIAFDAVLEP
jgi:hypothetical protein